MRGHKGRYFAWTQSSCKESLKNISEGKFTKKYFIDSVGENGNGDEVREVPLQGLSRSRLAILMWQSPRKEEEGGR